MAFNHWLIDDDLIKKKQEIVDKKKFAKYFDSIEIQKNDDLLLDEVLELIEFEIIDRWKPDNNKNEIFIELCCQYFEIIETMEIPGDEIERINFTLKLITYGYLGEKWESARRFLIENEEKLKISIKKEQNDWRERLLKTIYMAIFYIVKKRSWDDLTNSLKIISKLREEQKTFERKYIEDERSSVFKKAKALDLAALYHLAKSVEIVGQFQGSGEPNDPIPDLEFHFENSIKYTESSNNIELNLLLRLLFETFKKMINNSVWQVARTVNSRVTKFIKIITKSNRPIFELLYPQRDAILEKGLLDPAQRAIVVNLPTSSGKTFIAEFRILQALNQFAEEKGWVAYVVPTRALVNQVTVRLRNDLSSQPLNIKIEKMSGALDIDAYEEEIVENKRDFDILVTTPEKLNLIIRQTKIERPLALVVVDEAHNLESEERGLNLEILLSIIKKDCPKANFLLLTPFIPNSKEIAEWLAPQNARSIGIELNWQPNDRSLGIFYVEGERRHLKTFYKALITSKPTIHLDQDILIREEESCDLPFSVLNNTKRELISLAASQLSNHDSILVIARFVNDTYKIANELIKNLPDDNSNSEEVDLVRKFVIAELGEKFPLSKYLLKGVGIHHAGLPEEIRLLMEILMEKGLIKYLVATTTIAQGINFPVSAILMASYSYPYKKMPTIDFWNLAGRAGRMDQQSIGLLGVAVKGGKSSEDAKRTAEFFKQASGDLVSTLGKMVDDALASGEELRLDELYYKPQWSTFLQYIAHMYRQSKNLDNFINDIEMTMRRTWGYGKLSQQKREILLESVKGYAEKIDKRKELASLSDMTGFSPETIGKTINKLKEIEIKRNDWVKDTLFSQKPNTLKKLVGVMLSTLEISKHLDDIKFKGKSITQSNLAGFISDWVSGKEIHELTKKYFKEVNSETISYCVKSIYSKLANSAVWGLSAFQKIPGSGLNFEDLDEEERRNISNLPAMVYYGVNTNEALLLRKASVPRSISLNLGKEFKKIFGYKIFNQSYNDIVNWLDNLTDNQWKRAIPVGKNISGKEYKKIWRILSGKE